jgi:hypothetical protein
MAHAQRSLRKKIEDAKPRAVTEALVNEDEIHRRDDARLSVFLKVDVAVGTARDPNYIAPLRRCDLHVNGRRGPVEFVLGAFTVGPNDRKGAWG